MTFLTSSSLCRTFSTSGSSSLCSHLFLMLSDNIATKSHLIRQSHIQLPQSLLGQHWKLLNDGVYKRCPSPQRWHWRIHRVIPMDTHGQTPENLSRDSSSTSAIFFNFFSFCCTSQALGAFPTCGSKLVFDSGSDPKIRILTQKSWGKLPIINPPKISKN